MFILYYMGYGYNPRFSGSFLPTPIQIQAHQQLCGLYASANRFALAQAQIGQQAQPLPLPVHPAVQALRQWRANGANPALLPQQPIGALPPANPAANPGANGSIQSILTEYGRLLGGRLAEVPGHPNQFRLQGANGQPGQETYTLQTDRSLLVTRPGQPNSVIRLQYNPDGTVVLQPVAGATGGPHTRAIQQLRLVQQNNGTFTTQLPNSGAMQILAVPHPVQAGPNPANRVLFYTQGGRINGNLIGESFFVGNPDTGVGTWVAIDDAMFNGMRDRLKNSSILARDLNLTVDSTNANQLLPIRNNPVTPNVGTYTVQQANVAAENLQAGDLIFSGGNVNGAHYPPLVRRSVPGAARPQDRVQMLGRVNPGDAYSRVIINPTTNDYYLTNASGIATHRFNGTNGNWDAVPAPAGAALAALNRVGHGGMFPDGTYSYNGPSPQFANDSMVLLPDNRVMMLSADGTQVHICSQAGGNPRWETIPVADARVTGNAAINAGVTSIRNSRTNRGWTPAAMPAILNHAQTRGVAHPDGTYLYYGNVGGWNRDHGDSMALVNGHLIILSRDGNNLYVFNGATWSGSLPVATALNAAPNNFGINNADRDAAVTALRNSRTRRNWTPAPA